MASPKRLSEQAGDVIRGCDLLPHHTLAILIFMLERRSLTLTKREQEDADASIAVSPLDEDAANLQGMKRQIEDKSRFSD